MPVVSFMAGIGELFVRLHRTDILAEYHIEGDRQPEELALPFAAFATFEGRNGTVTLEVTGPGTVQARWSDAGVPQVVEYDVVEADKLVSHPAAPESLVATKSNGTRNGSSQPRLRPVTQSQLRAIHSICSNKGINLAGFLSEHGVDEAEDLSIKQASEIIDQLKK
jgi:hypothetical protein